MALNINGTTGISGVDGSASAPALQGTDSNTGINFGTDTVNINTGGTTRATVDSSGSFGIGTTSPAALTHISKTYSAPTGGFDSNVCLAITNNSSAGSYSGLALNSGASGGSYLHFGDTDDSNRGVILYDGDDAFKISTAGSERMRIDSSGGLFLGVTSAVSSSSGGICFRNNDAGRKELLLGTTTTSTRALVEFINGNGGVGSISVSGSNTSYNTSSDYRLKENVTTISDGITRLKTLKPSRFNFIADAETTVDGFLAHEVTAVPEAITGTKDEVATEDSVSHKKGDPIYQSIDQSKLVPLLTAALQEAVAKIEVLETKVAALEAG
jgi:hypothetical protein